MKQATVHRSLIAMLSVASLLAAPSAMAIILTSISSGQGPANISPAPRVAYVDSGALFVNGAMTLDASTPIFHFTTFELTAGSTLSFSNLTATDSVQLSASQSIRIFGELQMAPARGLYIQAPQVVIGQNGVIRLPGGSVTLVGGRDIDGLRPIIESGAGGALTLLPGWSIDISAAGIGHPAQPIRLGEGGVLQLADGSLLPSVGVHTGGEIVTLQAAVPEPGTLAMLLAGLVGWSAVRSRPLC